jgi:hypothetical protein
MPSSANCPPIQTAAVVSCHSTIPIALSLDSLSGPPRPGNRWDLSRNAKSSIFLWALQFSDCSENAGVAGSSPALSVLASSNHFRLSTHPIAKSKNSRNCLTSWSNADYHSICSQATVSRKTCMLHKMVRILSRGRPSALAQTWCVRLVTVFLLVLSPSIAFASCGDYLMIGSGGKSNQSTHQDDHRPDKNSISSQPHRMPCSGPECTRGSHDIPLAPPANAGFDEVRVSAISLRSAEIDDLATEPFLPNSRRSFPESAAKCIFHPPRSA